MAIPKNFEHALDMLPLLAKCAKERQVITYQELGDLVGVPAYFMGGPLDILRDQILLVHKLPRLDALVVNKETREVGDSFYAGGKGEISAEEYKILLEDERARVFAFEKWDETIQKLHAHYGGADYVKARSSR